MLTARDGTEQRVSLRVNPRRSLEFTILLGRDDAGNIKPKNQWLHKVKWDLVVFDEYHFGAWRDTAKELFEGEDDASVKKEKELEQAQQETQPTAPEEIEAEAENAPAFTMRM